MLVKTIILWFQWTCTCTWLRARAPCYLCIPLCKAHARLCAPPKIVHRLRNWVFFFLFLFGVCSVCMLTTHKVRKVHHHHQHVLRSSLVLHCLACMHECAERAAPHSAWCLRYGRGVRPIPLWMHARAYAISQAILGHATKPYGVHTTDTQTHTHACTQARQVVAV